MQRRDPLSWAKKMRWSMGDRASFTELIECLKEFNDGMYRLFPPKTRDTLDRALPPELLASTEDVVDLNAIEDASSGYPGLQTTAALKSISIRIEETPWTGSSIDRVASLQLILGQVNFPDWLSQPIQDGSGLRIITTYRASEIAPIKNVLIEMHRYDNKISPDLRLQLFFRVDKLARLLHTTPKPPDARVLDCLGWVDHPSYPSGPCVGFVYSIPLSTAQPQRSGSEPLSLQALLKQEKLPHLGTRFQLAQVLVRAILQLHAAGWLHKDLKSSNIIFFPESGSFQFPNLYITGFDFARPDGPDEISDIGGIVSPLSAASLYHHPEYSQNTGISNAQKKRFRRAYDVYALGCILLEIGLWRSLDSMWKPKYSPRVFRERLVDNWAKELGGRCGERYQKVVEDCLMAGDEAEAHETKELREFVWGVVDQLEKLSV
jgi:serine/threonine protein kinase